MQYITVKQASQRWGISDRRVRLLCAEGRIEGVVRKGRSYLIPADTLKTD
jgi:excisionase family DNA binding protein